MMEEVGMNEAERYVLFGAGDIGKKALTFYGKENILYFIDNDTNKTGTFVNGIEIKSLDDYVADGKEGKLIITAAWEKAHFIMRQLKQAGIHDFKVFNFQLFQDYALITNQYLDFEDRSEEEWNDNLQNLKSNLKINAYVNRVKDDVPLFSEVEIETINRCNGVCSFCPVNRNSDKRKEEKMDERLFRKIIAELEELQYSGRVALFSNNEPFLDERIIDFSKYTREHLPNAQIHLFTNGTLFNLQNFLQIIPYLDELIIDNYNQQLKLIKPVKEIVEYLELEEHENIRKKVKILLRKPNEVLTSRGGDAPNRKKILYVGDDSCALPFQQLVIRPSGMVSLCCNDPLGKETMGDLNQQSILEVWYGKKYELLRKKIASGRKNVEHCQHCDTFMTI